MEEWLRRIRSNRAIPKKAASTVGMYVILGQYWLTMIGVSADANVTKTE